MPPRLRGRALAAPVSPVVVHEDADAELVGERAGEGEAPADVAAVAVGVEQGRGRAAGDQPAVQPHAVQRRERDVAEGEAHARRIGGERARGVIDEVTFHRFPASRGDAREGHEGEQALHRRDDTLPSRRLVVRSGRGGGTGMLSREDNELLTRVDRGTPMGNAMRRYWIPALLAWELPAPDCPPVRAKLLGEELVAFRDTQDRIGLIDEYCPHRRTSLFFGRNEECGLRCVYHGWKFDVGGRCVDMPNEAAGCPLREKVRLRAYPCRERNGVVWTYLGPRAEPPPLPDFEWNLQPDNVPFMW